jgi:hypothetical protein
MESSIVNTPDLNNDEETANHMYQRILEKNYTGELE